MTQTPTKKLPRMAAYISQIMRPFGQRQELSRFSLTLPGYNFSAVDADNKTFALAALSLLGYVMIIYFMTIAQLITPHWL